MSTTSVGSADVAHRHDGPEPIDPGGSRRWLIPVAIGVLALIAAIAVAATSGARGSNDEILVGMINRDGSYDIHILSIGEEPARDSRALRDVETIHALYVHPPASEFGTTVATGPLNIDNSWLVQYDWDSYAHIAISSISRDETNEILEVDERPRADWVRDDGTLRIRISPDGESTECLVSDGHTSADRLRSGDNCYWTSEGAFVAFSEDNGDLEVEVELTNETRYRLVADDSSGWPAVSADGRYVAIATDESPNGRRYMFYDLQTGAVVGETPRYATAGRAAALGRSGSRLYASLADANENQDLFVFDPAHNGVLKIPDGVSAEATADNSLAFLGARSDDNATLTVLDLEAWELTEILESDRAMRWVLVPGNRVLVVEPSGDVTVATPGGEIHELGRVEPGELANSFFRVVDTNTLSLVREVFDDGYEASLYVIDLSSLEMLELVEKWAELSPPESAPGSDYLVFAGDERNRDRAALYAVRLDGTGGPIELDDDGVRFFGYTIRSGEVFYTADVGDEADDFEVRRVSLSSGERAVVLYEQARLIGTGWAEPSQTLQQR